LPQVPTPGVFITCYVMLAYVRQKTFFFLLWPLPAMFPSPSYSCLVTELISRAGPSGGIIQHFSFPSIPWFSGVPSYSETSFQNSFRNMLPNILTTCPGHPYLHFTRSPPSPSQQSSKICRRIQISLTCFDPNILRRNILTKEATILQHSGKTSVFYSRREQLVRGATPPSVRMYLVAQAVNITGPIWPINSAPHFL
jgi:hypothetical protein